MEIVYQSKFLVVYKKQDMFIQSWTEHLCDVEDYKEELMKFMSCFFKGKPKEIVVDVKKCQLVIPEAIEGWMAENVLIPISKKGIKKIAFTIAELSEVHIAIASSLDRAKPIIQSLYFADLEEAIAHSESVKEVNPPTFQYEANVENDSIAINLQIDSNDLPNFLSSMKQVEQDNQFARDHIHSYNTLTIREIEILKLIVKGNTNKQIGTTLFIEESSVKTHRKNIKAKLNIHSQFDLYQFARCFRLI